MKDSWDQYKNYNNLKNEKGIEIFKGVFSKVMDSPAVPMLMTPKTCTSVLTAAQAPRPALHSLVFFDLDVLLHLLHIQPHTFPEQVPTFMESDLEDPISFPIFMWYLCVGRSDDAIKHYMVYKILSCVWSLGSSSHQLRR